MVNKTLEQMTASDQQALFEYQAYVSWTGVQ